MRSLIALILGLIGAPALAQDSVLVPGFRACLTETVAANGSTIECVMKAQSNCDALEAEPERAMACYVEAKSEWGAQLGALLDSFSDKPQELQQVVRIEAKYSTIFNLMNCDLRMELSLVGRDPEPSDDLVRAQCEAFAAAASLSEVLFKSGTITR